MPSTPPSQRSRLSAIITFGARFLGGLGVILLCIGIFAVPGHDAFGYGKLLFIPILVFAAVAFHELGHFIGAKVMRMLVIHARIGPLELLPRLRSWKVRLCRPRVRTDAAGFLAAIPDFSRPIKAQQLVCTTGGPLANLIVAAICVAAGVVDPSSALLSVWWGFAALNICMGLANLLPNAATRSDGYQLIRIVRDQIPDDDYVYPRLVWLSYRGCTAEQLPKSELRTLASQPMPVSLLAQWFEMKSAQNRGKWEDATALSDQLISQIAAMDAKLATPLLSLLDLLRVEHAFSRAIHEQRPVAIPLETFASSQWYAPHIRPRCEALSAALTGDTINCERLLRASKREADRSPELAVHTSEIWLRDAVSKILSAHVKTPSVDGAAAT